MFERKTITAPLAIKADGDGAGRLEGYASVFGGVDSYGDTIVPGAYLETIPEFVFRGFLAHEHNWAQQLGTIAEAQEDERGLYIVSDFHADDETQQIRRRVQDRVDRQKFVGLSIGYEPLDYEFRAPNVGEPPPPYGDKIRVLKRIKLYEVSVVSVPADAAAAVTVAKRLDLPFDRHFSDVRVAVGEWLERMKSGSDLRVKDGRAPLTAERRAALESMSGSLREAARAMDALVADAAPKPKADALRLRSDHDRLRARLQLHLGVPA